MFQKLPGRLHVSKRVIENFWSARPPLAVVVHGRADRQRLHLVRPCLQRSTRARNSATRSCLNLRTPRNGQKNTDSSFHCFSRKRTASRRSIASKKHGHDPWAYSARNGARSRLAYRWRQRRHRALPSACQSTSMRMAARLPRNITRVARASWGDMNRRLRSTPRKRWRMSLACTTRPKGRSSSLREANMRPFANWTLRRLSPRRN